MIVPADLRALGVSPCGCGAAYKRTAGPWGCGRKGCDDLGRGGAKVAQTAGSERGATRLHPAPSKPRAGKAAEDALAALLDGAGYEVVTYAAWLARALEGGISPVFVREFPVGIMLSPPRRFRCDFLHPLSKVAIELEGGAHGIQKQRRGDILRAQLIEAAGLRILRVLPEQVTNGDALALVQGAVEDKR